MRTGRSGRGELGLRCNLGILLGLLSGGSGNLVLGLPAIYDVANSAQRATNQTCLVGSLAVRFKRFFGCQVSTGLGTVNNFLGNLHRHLNCSATNNTPPCGCCARALGGGQQLSGRNCCIIGNTQNALHNPFAKCECSASAFQRSFANGRNTGFSSVNFDWFAALHLGGSLAFYFGAKDLREHSCACTGSSANQCTHTGGNCRTRHRTKTCAACHRCEVCALPGQCAWYLGCQLTGCGQQAFFLISLFDGIEVCAFSSNLGDIFASLKARTRGCFGGTCYGLVGSLHARCQLLGPALELTTDGGLLDGCAA